MIINKNRLIIASAKNKEDVESVSFLVEQAHDESWFRDYPYSQEKQNKFLMNSLHSPDKNILLIARYDGLPIGVLFAACDEYILGYDFLMTNVYGLYVEKKFRGSLLGGRAAVGMLKICLRWSKSKGSRELMIHATAAINSARTDKFFRKLRFRYLGGNFSLRWKS